MIVIGGSAAAAREGLASRNRRAKKPASTVKARVNAPQDNAKAENAARPATAAVSMISPRISHSMSRSLGGDRFLVLGLAGGEARNGRLLAAAEVVEELLAL